MTNRISSIIIISLLVSFGVISSLLINYATETTPNLLKEYPYLIWLGIILVTLLTIMLTAHNSSNSAIGTRSNMSESNKSFKKNEVQNYTHNFPADVFISYSSKDNEWVHHVLKPKLLLHNFKVLTDADFKGGSLSIEQMAKAVENTKHTIAIMTKSFMNSEWTRFEAAMAQTLDPAASARKLIPVLKEDCEIPLNLRILHYRDFRTHEQWEQLIQDLI